MKELKVIFHVDELEKWDLAIKNAKNFLKEDGGAVINILANAEAVKSYGRGAYREDELVSLLNKGVKLIACNNAIRKFELDQEDLIPGVEVVPAGVVELTKKQVEGYAYIKP